jgi:hypothetical protein
VPSAQTTFVPGVMTTAFGGGEEPPPKLELHAETAAAMASNAAVDRIRQRMKSSSPCTASSPRLDQTLCGAGPHGDDNARRAVSFQRPFRWL